MALPTESLNGARLCEIPTPALIVDLDKMEANLAKMASLASGWGLTYRPHAKTHKAALIAARQIQAGATGICCAKLGEAEAMATGGADDILITSPVIGASKIGRLCALAQRARISIVADNAEALRETAVLCDRLGSQFGVLVEVDVGQRRCGIQEAQQALPLVDVIERSKGLRFRGLQGYQGKLQLEPNYATRLEAAKMAAERLSAVVNLLNRNGVAVETLTGGGTGSFFIDNCIGNLTEAQPGSYVYMDTRYTGIEWDEGRQPPPFQSSLYVLTSVISAPSRDRAIVDCGMKAASMDHGAPRVSDHAGATFSFAGDEHGVIEKTGPIDVDLSVGSTVLLTPSHCDTTVNLHDMCFGVRNGHVETSWAIQGRGKVQ